MSEDPFDDWETAADAGLNDFVDTNKKTNSKKAPQQKTTTDPFNTTTTPIIIHTNADSSYTQYKPEIKILKRPEHEQNRFRSRQNIHGDTEAGQQRPVYKTLAEKEKAYEEARRRIFNK